MRDINALHVGKGVWVVMRKHEKENDGFAIGVLWKDMKNGMKPQINKLCLK